MTPLENLRMQALDLAIRTLTNQETTAELVTYRAEKFFEFITKDVTKEELYHDDDTLNKVRKALHKYFTDSVTVTEIIGQMQNEGILFRERAKS